MSTTFNQCYLEKLWRYLWQYTQEISLG